MSSSGNPSNINGPSGPCGACRFLRRKCVVGCIFAPYFDSEEGAAHFAAVHKVFGASNVSKLLLQVPFYKRLHTVVTICYEAQARLRDPIFGCVSQIFALQQQVVNLQAELSIMQAQLASIDVRPPPPPPPTLITPSLSIADLPSASTVPTTYDLSSLFEPMVLQPWVSTQHRPLDPCQIEGSGTAASSSGCDGGGDLHALAHELLHRHNSPPLGRSIPIFHVSPPPSLSES